MAMSKDDYLSLLQNLLPGGYAWNKEPDSGLTNLLDALAEEFARIDQRGDDILDESDPRTTREMLTDWERITGMPDECTGDLATVQERRNAVVGVLTGTGGQSRAYFISLAAIYGYEITIDEFRPFRVGSSSVGDPLTSTEEWQHTWMVNAPEANILGFAVGQSTVGEPLRNWGNELLECSILKRKPAHTNVIFAYNL